MKRSIFKPQKEGTRYETGCLTYFIVRLLPNGKQG